MTLEKYNDFLSIENLAEIFSVSKQTIRKELKAGKFGTPLQIGRAFRIPRTYIISKFFTTYN